MKKDLIIVLIVGLVLGGGVVYFYKTNDVNLEVKNEKTKNIIENKQTMNDLNELAKQFKDISKGKTYTQLIKDPKYKDWVEKINVLIEVYKKQGKKDEVNYIYYNFIANNVLNDLKGYSDLEKDLIIQSIRRLDFNNLTDKNNYTQLMKDYVDVTYFQPIMKNLGNIDTKKLDTDKKYFYKTMLDPQNGIFYKIFKNRYEWNKTGIGFKPEFLENQFVDFLAQRFEQILAKLGYDKAWFKKKVFEYYNINSLKELAKLINQDFQNIKTKYNIEKLGIPTDRFFRHDERRYLFAEDGLHKDLYKKLGDKVNDFKNDVKQYRLKMYLLSYLGREINLFNDKVRAKFVNPEEGGGIQNLFRVGRYIDEVLKLELKPETK